MNMDYVRATQIAATVGQGMAFLFGFIGLFTNPFLLFIAFFVWMGASQEASMAQMKNALGGIPVTRAMLTDFETLSPRDNLSRVAQLVLAGSQRDFPVVDDNRVLGIVTRDDFLKALTQHGEHWPVSQVMHANLPVLDSYEMVENALLRLQESGIPVLPVTHAGQLVGIITPENITEYLMIRSALKAGRAYRSCKPNVPKVLNPRLSARGESFGTFFSCNHSVIIRPPKQGIMKIAGFFPAFFACWLPALLRARRSV